VNVLSFARVSSLLAVTMLRKVNLVLSHLDFLFLCLCLTEDNFVLS
jgi:hypothetical protein